MSERQPYRPHGECDCGQPATEHMLGETICARCAKLQREAAFRVKHGESTYAARVQEAALAFRNRVIAPHWDKHIAEFWKRRGMKPPANSYCIIQGQGDYQP